MLMCVKMIIKLAVKNLFTFMLFNDYVLLVFSQLTFMTRLVTSLAMCIKCLKCQLRLWEAINGSFESLVRSLASDLFPFAPVSLGTLLGLDTCEISSSDPIESRFLLELWRRSDEFMKPKLFILHH